ncbi:MAG: CoA-binding protein [Promethearchaeota archaeon]
MSSKNLSSLKYLFYPQNVAIFGASEKLWYMVKGFEEHGFEKNKLYFINPNKDELFGRKCYKSIKEIPEETIDLLILAVRRDILVQNLKELIKQKDIKTIHIFTAGTGESDEKGIAVENELFSIFNNENRSTRAIGPNCMGVYSVKGHLAYEPFLPTEPGNISLVFQSGDLHSQTIRIGARRHNLKYSKGVSIGNCIDLQISDFLQYYNDDDDTDLIMVYFEGINAHYPSEGKNLLKSLRSMKKPILFLHGGKTSRAQKAALTHTGSISTNRKIWNAIYKQTPIVEVPTSIDDMIDYAFIFNKVINRYKNKNRIIYPKGKNVLLILWSGGFGIIDTNTLAELGLNIPYFEGETLEKLREIYPIKIGSLSNPLDIPWVSSSETYLKIAKVASSEDIDLVIIETDKWEEEPNFESYYNNLLAIREHVESLNKIFMLILPEYPARHRYKYYKKLIDDDFIVYPSVHRAGKAFLALYNYGKKIENLK